MTAWEIAALPFWILTAIMTITVFVPPKNYRMGTGNFVAHLIMSCISIGICLWIAAWLAS